MTSQSLAISIQKGQFNQIVSDMRVIVSTSKFIIEYAIIFHVLDNFNWYYLLSANS